MTLEATIAENTAAVRDLIAVMKGAPAGATEATPAAASGRRRTAAQDQTRQENVKELNRSSVAPEGQDSLPPHSAVKEALFKVRDALGKPAAAKILIEACKGGPGDIDKIPTEKYNWVIDECTKALGDGASGL